MAVCGVLFTVLDAAFTCSKVLVVARSLNRAGVLGGRLWSIPNDRLAFLMSTIRF